MFCLSLFADPPTTIVPPVTTTGIATLTNKTLTAPVINSPSGLVKGDVGLGNVDNTSDATKNTATVKLSNKTLDATNLLSPAVTMLPDLFVVAGDSLSCAGQLYWPSNFTGTALGLTTTGGVTSYNAVASYPGGSPASNATGVKPLTSWPEQLVAISGAPSTLYNFAFSGRYANDIPVRYFQSEHLVAPVLTGIPAAYGLLIGTNDTGGSIAAATTDAYIDQVFAWARADGFWPLVAYTVPVATNWGVGGTQDTIRTTINTHLASLLSSGAIDVLVDTTTITGLTSTNVAGTWTHDVPANWSSGFPNHFTAAGNALIAAQTYTQLKALTAAIPSKTQTAVLTANQFSYNNLAPWARRRLNINTDAQSSNSNGSVNLGDGIAGAIGIQNGTANTSWSRTFWYVAFPGFDLGYNGGTTLTGKGKYVLDWGRPQRVEVAVHPDWGNSGHTFPNTVWQVLWGVANGRTPAALANGDYAIGLQFTCTSAGQLVVKAIAANGTTATVSSTLATFSDLSSDWRTILCQIYSDGNGNLYVTLNGTTTFLAGIAPTHILRTDTACMLDAYSSAAEANNGYLEFSAPDVSSQ